MNEEIDQLNTELIDFYPDINLEGLQVGFDLADTNTTIERIKSSIKSSTALYQDNYYTEDGSQRPITNYSEFTESQWNCLNCSAQFNIRQVDCSMCKIFRPLETYQNIMHRPDRVSPTEIAALDLRRKSEKQVILDLEYKGDAGLGSDDEEAKNDPDK